MAIGIVGGRQIKAIPFLYHVQKHCDTIKQRRMLNSCPDLCLFLGCHSLKTLKRITKEKKSNF